MNYLKSANDFYKEGCEEFGKAIKLNNRVLLRDACEKAWGAVVQATNELFLKKGVSALPKSHRDRRLLLRRLSQDSKDIRGSHIADRFMARDDALHQRGFYNGNIDEEEVNIELEKVKEYMEDVERM